MDKAVRHAVLYITSETRKFVVTYYTFALPKMVPSLGGVILVEERLEALQEPWTSFVIEFPTYPKQFDPWAGGEPENSVPLSPG